ncbi:hypothetical protein C4577_06010 [Candidatus Parcubacteria bacterium]|nr:MAG: hypothetical protein C4577_06010 [Candidatus Parcubacteria bacterium]
MKNNFSSDLTRFKFQKKIGAYTGLILILLFSLIPLTDLFHPGLPLTHDGQDHVARIANFYQSFSEGNFIPRWAANLNWGYGHPILMFLYPLPSYASSLFHFIGFSLTDSLKIVFGLSFILSGLAMYLWVRNFLGEASALIAGVFYIFAPYRFVDLYVRGAIGEHTAFIFPPLLLYFLLKLFKVKSSNSHEQYFYSIGIAFSLAGFILSHNAISLMFLPFIFFYVLYLSLDKKIKTNSSLIKSQLSRLDVNYLIKSLSFLAFGFLISSYFWVPAFFEGKYTLRDIVTKGEYANHFVNAPRLFSSVWSYGGSQDLSVQIGIIHLIGTVLSVFLAIKLFHKSKKIFMLYILSLMYLLISLVLMLDQSIIIWQKVTILQKFQFPWRLLSVVVFMSSFLAAIAFYVIENKKMKKIILIIFLASVIIFNKDYWRANDYLYLSDSFFKSIYNGTTDTGESGPKWSVRFMEKRPNSRIEIIEGSGNIKEIFRGSTDHRYIIESPVDSARVRENTLYFPGWAVFVDGKPVNVEFQDPRHRGLITFYVDKGKHLVEIIFAETKLRQASNILSLISFITILVYGAHVFSLKRQKKTK